MLRSATTRVFAAAIGLFLVGGGAHAQYRRLPDGVDNLMPRYYDYRAPRTYYFDDAPIGFEGYQYGPPAVIYPPASPVPQGYAPAGAYPPRAYAPPVYGYAPPVQAYPVAPTPVRPVCGPYRFWRDGRCIDARGN